MLAELFTIILLILTIIWLYLRRVYNYWDRHGIPNVAAQFPYGSLKESMLMKKNIGVLFKEYYSKYKNEKKIGFYGPFKPYLLINDPELIKTVLSKEFTSFGDQGFTVDKDIDPLLAYNPFGEAGMERWKSARGIHTPMVTLSRIKAMSMDMIKSAENLQKYIMANCDKTLEMKYLSRLYTTDAVAMAIFGLDSDSFFTKNSPFNSVSEGEMFTNSSDANYAAVFDMFVPFLNKIYRARTLSKHMEKFLLELYNVVVQHRKQHGIKRNDLIQRLIELDEKAIQENRKSFSNPEIAAHCLALYGDSVDTTGIVIVAAAHHLACDKEIQEKLRTEIQNSIKDLNELTYDTLQSFSYLEMVVTEAFRMYPPVPFLSRTCTKEIILDGYKMKPGDKVFIPTWGIHMDPDYYPEPEKFIPERFIKEKRSEMKKYTHLPFGEGPRMCLGFRFALAEIKVVLVALILKFQLSLEKEPTSLEADSATIFVYNPKGDIDIKFTPL